jgi:hypothetical protein
MRTQVDTTQSRMDTVEMLERLANTEKNRGGANLPPIKHASRITAG